jgi:hypothetical protein
VLTTNAHGLRVHRAPGIPCALTFEEGRFSTNSGALRGENIHTHPLVSTILPYTQKASSGGQWLPLRHDCCADATVLEHLTVSTSNPCLRRFLATPLHEIIPS